MKFIHTFAIALVALHAPLGFAQEQKGTLTIADIVSEKGPASKIWIKDLPDTFKPVKITLTNESVFGTLMLTQFAMRPGAGPNLLDALTSYWTTGAEVDLDGHKFLVTYKVDMPLTDLSPMPGMDAPNVKDLSLVLNLMRVDHIASIVPVPSLKKDQLQAALAPSGEMAEVAMAAAPAGQEARPVSASTKTQALSNIKQIAIGQIMYTGDYDDVMPYVQNTATVREVIRPYIKNDSLWKNPNPNGGRVLFNIALAGTNVVDVPFPAETPMFYDERAWPDGSHLVAYLDGHAKSVSATDWAKIQKALKQKFKKVKGVPLPVVKETMF